MRHKEQKFAVERNLTPLLISEIKKGADGPSNPVIFGL